MSEPAPTIIIGAGRSGTNMLRDILVQLPGLVTWPCDEINYIWRHGNRSFPTDEFSRAMATAPVAAYIRRKFEALSAGRGGAVCVEKTCANSLRCGFVDEIFPKARFLHIIRDGRDVSVSAGERWSAKLDPRYILKKARYVPPTDLPWYGLGYLKNRIDRLFSREGRLSVWGPRFTGMEAAFRDHPLPVACAIQWRACVSRATSELAQLAPERVLTLRYETFASAPPAGLAQICDFIGVQASRARLEELTTGVSQKSVGRWRQKLAPAEVAGIERHAGDLLDSLGYERASDVA